MLFEKNVSQRLLQEGLLQSAEKLHGKTAIITEEGEYTYSDLLESATRLANHLISCGFRPGDRCLIYMENTWPCVVSIYAVLIAGGVFVIVNPQTKKDKLKYIFSDCDPTIFITDTRFQNIFSDFIGEIDSIKRVITSGSPALLDNPAIESFEKIVSLSSGVNPGINGDVDDLSALIYTSGSSGVPKGVMQTHASMVFALSSIIRYLRLSGEDRFLLVLPLAFDYGLYQLLMSVQLGATLVLEKPFSYPARIFKRITDIGVTVFACVPTIFTIILSIHRRKAISFPSVKKITNTAAALPPEYIDSLKEVFPEALIYNMYGQTECKRVSYLEPEKIDKKPSSVGRAIPGTEVFLLDEQGNRVPPGVTGMLYVRGAHIMRGYWRQDALTEEVLIDGLVPGETVLCTKDWFKMDEEGDLYFQGRSDDIINTRGEKVSPVEVENVLYGIEGIADVAVIGVADELLGEAVKCFVVIEEGSGLTMKDIKKACTEKLESHVVPKYFELRDSLPRTSSGKISKKGLN